MVIINNKDRNDDTINLSKDNNAKNEIKNNKNNNMI